jgi:hypothetical protein
MYASGDCSQDLPNVYEPLSTARWVADDALSRLGEWTDDEVPDRTELTATAAVFAGYSLALLGEAMCGAALDLGPAMTPAEILTEADSRLSTAITAAQSAGNDDLLNLARVGRARVRLNLGQTADAAADAALVPAGFSYEFQYSSLDDATENKLWVLMQRSLQANVEPMYRDMEFLGVPDSRVQIIDLGVQAPGTTIDMFAAAKYPSIESPVEVATWEEAQLIMAEAAIEDGRLQDAVDIFNDLHAQVGLPDFVSNDEAEIRAQLIYERSAELFLEGHHLQDIKRLGIPLVPAPGTPAVHGGQFSNQTCFPLPDVEYLNNPNIPNP